MNFNKIALGAVQFGMDYGISNDSGQTPIHEISRILSLANTLGISLIDTAISYGSSEKNLGEVGVSSFNIVSKLPSGALKNRQPQGIILEHIKESLIRLNKKSLYGFLSHNASDLLSLNGEKIYKVLIEAKQNGLINKIGASVYHPDEITQLMNYYDLDIIQAPFNIIDDRLIKSGLMRDLYKSNVEIHVRSIFLQGLLIMDPSVRLLRFKKWKNLWNNWEEWLNDLKVTPIEACLSYAHSFEEISKVIIGVETEQQLKEISNLKLLKFINIPDKLKIDDQLLINPVNWINP